MFWTTFPGVTLASHCLPLLKGFTGRSCSEHKTLQGGFFCKGTLKGYLCNTTKYLQTGLYS